MTANTAHTSGQTDPRSQREPPPPEPPEPDERPGRGLAPLVLVTVLIVGALIATGLTLLNTDEEQAGAVAAPAPAAARTVSVTLKEFTISPLPAVGRTGRVTFKVRNAGRIKHEFVVLRTSKAAADLRKGAEADERGNVGEIGGLRPGATKILALRLRPGHYALVCNLPGHYLAGQHADFTVR
jgi:uncharacterized cupredoxin-like copper-binding protein